jgi:hypothetical protein
MQAIETRQPSWTKSFCELNPEKLHVPLERIVLPLASDGRTVDMLLVVSLFGEASRATGNAARSADRRRKASA